MRQKVEGSTRGCSAMGDARETRRGGQREIGAARRATRKAGRRATGRGQGSARAEGYKQPPVLRMSNGKRSHTGAAFRRPHFGGNRIQGVILPGFHFQSPSFASAAGLLGEFCCPHKPTNNTYSNGGAEARCSLPAGKVAPQPTTAPTLTPSPLSRQVETPAREFHGPSMAPTLAPMLRNANARYLAG
jgi:hypothetical protein